ncbi:hypothetical protein [Streptomyces sp. NPDC051576]|uniref:hypothetical protein n=1 Tax=Streptomyces sp. NPDC051576 TaxID=3155803 RepID=UPI00344723B8
MSAECAAGRDRALGLGGQLLRRLGQFADVAAEPKDVDEVFGKCVGHDVVQREVGEAPQLLHTVELSDGCGLVVSAEEGVARGVAEQRVQEEGEFGLTALDPLGEDEVRYAVQVRGLDLGEEALLLLGEAEFGGGGVETAGCEHGVAEVRVAHGAGQELLKSGEAHRAAPAPAPAAASA